MLPAFSFSSWRTRFKPEAMRTVFFLALVVVAMLFYLGQLLSKECKYSSGDKRRDLPSGV